MLSGDQRGHAARPFLISGREPVRQVLNRRGLEHSSVAHLLDALLAARPFQARPACSLPPACIVAVFVLAMAVAHR
ncbi:MAG TPA: hypothetical protein VIZ18_11315 [Ktedonobacteraceae bacterium]